MGSATLAFLIKLDALMLYNDEINSSLAEPYAHPHESLKTLCFSAVWTDHFLTYISPMKWRENVCRQVLLEFLSEIEFTKLGFVDIESIDTKDQSQVTEQLTELYNVITQEIK